MGLGVGTVLIGWLSKDKSHTVACLDYLNEKARKFAYENEIAVYGDMIKEPAFLDNLIETSDIVVVHYWDNHFLARLLSRQLPENRMVFWCHQNYYVPPRICEYPDLILGVSPIQQFGGFIWSTGNMERFAKIEPVPHEGFNVGYTGTVDYKKIHPEFIEMCKAIKVDDIYFYVIGENNIGGKNDKKFTFTGKVDDVAPYLARFDVFGYPLKRGSYATCEQAIGEAMCAGVPVVALDNEAESTILDDLADDEYDYIRKIEHLATHRVLLKEMSEQAREDGLAIYNINRMVWQWNGVFGEMMKSPKTTKGVL
jgi:glycosyltransferase involved in cell wall biosynthesis